MAEGQKFSIKIPTATEKSDFMKQFLKTFENLLYEKKINLI